MSSQISQFAQFLGHLHPMLVHLPVGGLVVLGALELLAALPRFKDLAQNRRVILGFVTLGAVAAAACGWLLSLGGGYETQLLYRHRLMGFCVAGACIVTLLLCWPNRLGAYRIALTITIVLLVFAGHLGSEMTHGRDFLTAPARGAWRALFGAPAHALTAGLAQPDGKTFYAQIVQPILQRRCVSCHGPEKQKGKLRLDSFANLRRGGEVGPALVPGNAAESLMIRRLLLPPEDEDHMPPDGKPQPTQSEIDLLQWWIKTGAVEDGTIASLNPSAEVMRMIEEMKARQTH
jgi:hypothetical protein